MANSNLKIVIPMAGHATRLRPLTWSRPKPLLRIADKLVIDYLLDTFTSLPNSTDLEYIFIYGSMGSKIEEYMQLAHPDLNVRYIEQAEMRGQSHAISLAREYLTGPIVLVYSDTLIDPDFSSLTPQTTEAIAWVKAVPDPRRFGVASLGEDGWVTHLVEKPQDATNNLALVGCYYIPDATVLVRAIDEQMRRNISLKNEFFLADGLNIMLEYGVKMRVEHVNNWLDAGTVDAVLSTNRFILDKGQFTSPDTSTYINSVILPPVYIHSSASVENSVIGPHVSIGAGCTIRGCIIRDSIIDDNSTLESVNTEHSLIGRSVKLSGHSGTVNLGDQSVLQI